MRDRLSWMRFLGLGLGDPVPDANTIWTFREALTKAGASAPKTLDQLARTRPTSSAGRSRRSAASPSGSPTSSLGRSGDAPTKPPHNAYT